MATRTSCKRRLVSVAPSKRVTTGKNSRTVNPIGAGDASVAKRHKCTQCLKSFRWRVGLKVHLRVHSGEKPFKCDVCDKRFNTSCNLNRHLRIHSGQKPFKCDVCDKRFNCPSNLNSHFRSRRHAAVARRPKVVIIHETIVRHEMKTKFTDRFAL